MISLFRKSCQLEAFDGNCGTAQTGESESILQRGYDLLDVTPSMAKTGRFQ